VGHECLATPDRFGDYRLGAGTPCAETFSGNPFAARQHDLIERARDLWTFPEARKTA
jgi:hypothetical protein